MQQHHDHDEDRDLDRDGEHHEAGKNPAPYVPRRARSPLLLLLAMLLLALLALGGIIGVMMIRAEDPAAIHLPSYQAQSLEQSLQKEEDRAKAVTGEDNGKSLGYDPRQQEQQIKPDSFDDFQQEETPLDLTPSPLSVGPQSGLLPAGRDVLRQTPVRYQPVPRIKPSGDPVAKAITPRQFHGTKPQIVIVIDDMGLNRRNSRRVVDLDAPMTLAYLPYAERLDQQTQDAYSRGHELMVHMPMEPDNVARNNPGPDALLGALPDEEMDARIRRNLSRFDHYIGINNHMGSKLTADPHAMRLVMDVLKERGLWFLDSRTIGHSVAGKVAGERGVPYAVRDVFLDNVAEVTAVKQQLYETEKVAARQGHAIAIGHPHDATIRALQEWLPEAKHKGFVIAPLSAIIAARFPDADVPRYARIRPLDKQKNSQLVRNNLMATSLSR